MKKIFPLFVIFLIFLVGCKTFKPVVSSVSDVNDTPESSAPVTPEQINFSDQITWLLGYFNPVQMKPEPHSIWFYKQYDSYQPDTLTINKLKNLSREGLVIKIVMGTWCPDSRREVPRFMRILDVWQFPFTQVTFIGVDDSKLSPVGEYDKLNIERVPTFIIYKNNVEAGRIIENPETSLEQDIINILTGNE